MASLIKSSWSSFFFLQDGRPCCGYFGFDFAIKAEEGGGILLYYNPMINSAMNEETSLIKHNRLDSQTLGLIIYSSSSIQFFLTILFFRVKVWQFFDFIEDCQEEKKINKAFTNR